MNWTAIGAIGEIVGALAVVISLGYLASQIRGNTKALRRQASHEAVSGINAFFTEVTRTTEMSEIFGRGIEGFEHLTREETAWFRFALFQLFKVLEDMHFQHAEGILDDEQWAGWHWIAAQYLASPEGKEYFAFARQSFSPRFREFYATLRPETSFERVGRALGVKTS